MFTLCVSLIHAAAASDAVFVVHGVAAGPLPAEAHREWRFYDGNPILVGEEEYELQAGEGNVYAPDVHRDGDVYRMWYGGQGRDGHDRVLLAESDDGLSWRRSPANPVIDVDNENHVNDPSVAYAGDTAYVAFSVAPRGEEDEIHLASSADGVRWERRGTVIRLGEPGAWDSFKVGRPSLLREADEFRMWYDGTNSLPDDASRIGDPAARHVGLATSSDGVTWTPHPSNPLVMHSGAIDVARVAGEYVMLAESGQGTRWLTSADGVAWEDRGFLFRNSGEPYDLYGQVTPMAYVEDGEWVAVYYGGAPADNWNRNCIAVAFAQKRVSIRGAGGAQLDARIRARERSVAVVVAPATGGAATLTVSGADGRVEVEQPVVLQPGQTTIYAR